MKTIFKLAFFNIALNFMIGLLLMSIPVFHCVSGDANYADCKEITSGIDYDSSQASTIDSENNNILNPNKQLESNSGLFSSILDIMTFGLYSKIKIFLGPFLVGFWNILESILGPLLPDTVSTFIFTGLKTFTTLGSIFVVVWFLTGKKVIGKEFD